MNFYIFWRLKLTKISKSSLQKCKRVAFLELPGSQRLISRKICVTENCWNFHTVISKLNLSIVKYTFKWVENTDKSWYVFCCRLSLSVIYYDGSQRLLTTNPLPFGYVLLSIDMHFMVEASNLLETSPFYGKLRR